MLKRISLLSGIVFFSVLLVAQVVTTRVMKVCGVVAAPSELSGYIDTYKDSVNRVMSKVIATSSVTYDKKSADENLQQLTSEALKQAALPLIGKVADAAMCNNGGLRNVLNAGDVTIGDVFSIFPFENSLVVLLVDGRTLLEYKKLADAHKKVYISLPENIEPRKKYHLVTIDYLADGNDGLASVKRKVVRSDYPILLRDVMLEYITKAKSL